MKRPDSYIFTTIVRFSFFLINLFAVYLLLRGHDLPGGGFIGGLATAISLVLLSLAIGVGEIHRVMRFDPVRVAATGLLLSALTSAAPLLWGKPFLEHMHLHVREVPLLGELHLGTPLLFDLGVALVVVGVTCKTIFILAKSTSGLPGLAPEERSRYSAEGEKPLEDKGGDDAN